MVYNVIHYSTLTYISEIYTSYNFRFYIYFKPGVLTPDILVGILFSTF